MQPVFTSLADICGDFSIINSAQIEPADPREPDEIFRMWYSGGGKSVVFDVIFYPGNRAVLERVEEGREDSRIGVVKSTEISNAKELRIYLSQTL